MATNSNILQDKRLNKNTFRSFRSPGFFAKWPIIGITMFLFGSLLFGALALNVVDKNPGLLKWDQSTVKIFQTEAKSIPSSIAEYVIFGFFVGREIIIIVGTILATYFFHKRFWLEFMMVMWGPGLGGLLWFALSRYFDRPRPPTQMDVLAITDPSFPSGHVLSAVLLYGLLAYLLVPKMPSRFWKWFVVVLALLVIVWVGLSRLLVGGHYSRRAIFSQGENSTPECCSATQHRRSARRPACTRYVQTMAAPWSYPDYHRQPQLCRVGIQPADPWSSYAMGPIHI
jgi:undecaprenyl-diphosphatase